MNTPRFDLDARGAAAYADAHRYINDGARVPSRIVIELLSLIERQADTIAAARAALARADAAA